VAAQSDVKVKSGNTYTVTYSVEGSIDTLTTDQLKTLALRQLRMGARSYVQAQLQAAEPAVVTAKKMFEKMVESGLGSQDQAKAFFESMGMNLEIPTVFKIKLSDILPDEGSTRGKKAADIFSAEVEKDEEEETPAA
jgi:hypothetical protein